MDGMYWLEAFFHDDGEKTDTIFLAPTKKEDTNYDAEHDFEEEERVRFSDPGYNSTNKLIHTGGNS